MSAQTALPEVPPTLPLFSLTKTPCLYCHSWASAGLKHSTSHHSLHLPFVCVWAVHRPYPVCAVSEQHPRFVAVQVLMALYSGGRSMSMPNMDPEVRPAPSETRYTEVF